MYLLVLTKSVITSLVQHLISDIVGPKTSVQCKIMDCYNSNVWVSHLHKN